ncbi:ABC-2 transporter permease [uncultured Dubosiella sp.]|uniref:ABC-2 transporter permease n=1 Tax=uncultured Dubosiella sp. TaxID=1937011 RepID=UPI00259AFA3F|nr:ABC-2 transporter permease [uncultured Dubosiella sp.]
MKGLLRKDLQLIWASWPILLMILVCGTGISIYIQQPTMEICFVTLLLVFQTVATIMNDQTSGWFPWELTLPVSRKGIVYEKFILALIVLAFGTCLALLIYWGVSAITHVTIDRVSLEINLAILLVFFGFGVAPGLLLSFYKKEAGPIAMMVAALLPVAILLVVMNTVSDTKIKEVFMILAAISMVLYFAIMVISPKIVTGWLNRNT